MNTSPIEQIRQILEQNPHEVDEIKKRSSAIKTYKDDEEKEIISFQFPGIRQRLLLKIVYVKGNNAVQIFFRRWGKSLCETEYKLGLCFLERGLAVPKPLLWGEKRRLGLLQKAYYLGDEITDSLLLTEYLDKYDKKEGAEKIKEKRAILRNVGKYIGTMHAKLIYHGVLMPHHVLLEKVTKGYKIYLFDLEYCETYTEPNPKAFLKDLRKLNKYTRKYQQSGSLTRTDKLRFLKEYHRANPEIKISDIINTLS